MTGGDPDAQIGRCLRCGKRQRVDGAYRVCTDCGAALDPKIETKRLRYGFVAKIDLSRPGPSEKK